MQHVLDMYGELDVELVESVVESRQQSSARVGDADGGKSGATYDEMVATYRQSVLTAFSEVEDNLAAQALLADQYSEESDALLAARKQLEIANNRYRDGLITYLEVATAESTALNVEFDAVQLHGQQLVAAVTLIKSLGGGWRETMNDAGTATGSSTIGISSSQSSSTQR